MPHSAPHPRRAFLRLILAALGASAALTTPAFAVGPVTFNVPTHLTSGGRSVVRAISTWNLPIADADGFDSGAEFVAPLNLNGDGGAYDLVTADHDSKLIRVRMQPVGGGDAYTNLDITAAAPPEDLAVMDVNGDNQLDLVTVEAGQLVVRLNTRNTSVAGDLSFGAPTSYGANDEDGLPLTIKKVVICDVDHDHLNELVGVGTKGTGVNARIQVAVFHNTLGQAQPFAAAVIYGAPGTGDFVVAGNLTRNEVAPSGSGTRLDWFPEIVVASNNGDNFSNGSGSGSFTTFLNKGNGTFGSDTDAAVSARPIRSSFYQHFHALALADVDKDGNRDLLFETSSLHGNPLSGQMFLQVQGGAGTGAFGGWYAYAYLADSPAGSLFHGDIAAVDLNGDNNVDLAVTDPVDTHGVIVYALDPAAANHAIFGTDYPNPNQTKIATAAGARAIAITEHLADNRYDLVVANDDSNQLSFLDNSTGGGGGGGGGGTGDPLPQGRVITFGTVNESAVEGDTITVPLLRGLGSTGQVVVYLGRGGTAVESFNGANRNADFDFIDPATGAWTYQPVTFAEDEHRKSVTIKMLKNSAAEVRDTLVLTIGEPVGDAAVGDPSEVTINIIDGQPSILANAGALAVKPTNLVKSATQTQADLKALYKVKAVARTHALWDFTVAQAFPKNALKPAVKLQVSQVDPVSTNPADWSDFLPMVKGAGTSWAGHTAIVPVGAKVYFRTVASADNYSPVIGKPVGPFRVENGPDIALRPRQHTSLAGGTAQDPNYVIYEVGTTVDDVITYRLNYSAAGDATALDATNVVIEAPIPKHATYLNHTIGGATQVKLLPAINPTKIQWKFASLPKGSSGSVDLLVQVNSAAQFGGSTKALGKTITETGFSLTSDQTVKNPGDVTALTAVIHGPIEIGVSRSGAAASVRGGDLITYSVTAKNISGNPLSGIVRDRIPLGTVLEAVYFPDINGNSTDLKVPNPGPDPVDAAHGGPAVVYVLLKNAGFLGKKQGDVVDINLLTDAQLKLVLDLDLVAQEVLWVTPLIAANSQLHLKFTVRVLYDIATAVGVNHPTQIVNDDFDFTTNGGAISALYGHKPGENTDPSLESLTSAIIAGEPTVTPILQISKGARGDQTLNNPALHGNGSARVPGFGDVVTTLQGHGVDYELTFENSGDVDAHNVVIHDVIPAGTVLTGFFKQTANGGAPFEMTADQFRCYDANSVAIPLNAANITKVRSMDIDLGHVQNLTVLPAHTFGTIRYTCQPTITPTTTLVYAGVSGGPGQIHSFGGFDQTQKASSKLQGFFITTTDLVAPAKGSPDDLVVRVLTDISWDHRYERKACNAIAGQIISFDVTFTQNGDVTANNAHMDFTVQAGVTVLTGISSETGTDYTPRFLDNNQTIPISAVDSRIKFSLGNVPGHSSRTLRFWMKVSEAAGGGLDPTLAKVGRVWPQNLAFGPMKFQAATAARTLLSATSVTPADTSTQKSGNESPTTVGAASAPKLSISRNAPYTVKKDGTFTYAIFFANSGETAATNVNVGMQVPYFTSFVSATNGIIREVKSTLQFPDGIAFPTANPNAFTATNRTAAQVKVTGPGYDILTWHFDTLPAHASGYIELKVKVQAGFADECIKDHSLYVNASNANSAVLSPNPIGTWVLGKPFDTARWEILSCFCEHLGIAINEQTKPALRAYVNTLRPDTLLHACGGLDALQVNGVSVYALGNNQVLVIGSNIVASGGGNIVATGGGNVISNDGGSIVASGAGNAITINNIPGFGSKDCAYLLANAPAIVATGGGNIVASGAGNLISQDGGGFVLKSNLAGGGFTPIAANLNGLIAGGGGNLISQDGGGFIGAVGAKLISQDGGGLLSQDGGGLLGQSKGTFTVISAGQVISRDGAGLISQDGGGIVAAGGSK